MLFLKLSAVLQSSGGQNKSDTVINFLSVRTLKKTGAVNFQKLIIFKLKKNVKVKAFDRCV